MGTEVETMMLMFTGIATFIAISAFIGWLTDVSSVRVFMGMQICILVGAVVIYFVKLGISAAFS